MAILRNLLPGVFTTPPHRLQSGYKNSESGRRQCSAGLTLIELMVSVAVLSGGILALSAVTLSVSQGNQQSSALSFMAKSAST